MTPLKQILKKNKIITWICIGITALFIVLQCVLGGYWIAGSIFGGIMIYGSVVVNGKLIRRSFCPSCEEKYDYQNDVAWECTHVETTARKQKADVEVECTCHACGHKTAFKERFVTGEVDEFGAVQEYSLYDLVRKHFIK